MIEHCTMAEVVRHGSPLVLPAGTTVQEACTALHERHAGAVLVMEEGRLKGIFTGRDAVACLARGLDPERTLIGQVMTADPCCLPPDATAIDALRLMNDGGFRHLPIVRDGEVVGLVSRYDLRGTPQRRLDEETGFFEVLR
ncbi:CBS domain-containing protein [Sabulicella glaciei]|uniref:CBS domain-containing protein n=1 Tax=Sabulicella glaciei TaxID=2984948 RepID=A0ABT3NVM4_9PROT|nr:CBS domain-containing protein [Roseococcus sp. MDT2-1-1]MCW8086200.1 CBS domain-containing protein [Roseococcus sp. MDT2-1-1]